jgi:plasmid replication initiation protein
MAGVGLKTAYRDLKNASERLFRREVTLHEAPNGQGKAKIRLTRWVQEVVYQEDQGTVALRFSQPMVPYLSQLSAQFTKYALADVAQMTSSHAIRLYELLCQWRDAGEREMELGWFREALQLEGRYDNIRDLKRRVIEPAIEQVNKHSPLWVKWSQRKTGRRVSHLVFTFGEKTGSKQKAVADKRYKLKNTQTSDGGHAMFGVPAETIQRYAKPGDSWSDAALKALEARRGTQA